MHKQGHVQRWDAERGFGFIRAQGTGADIFFHIKDYRGARAPARGDTVWFEEIHVGGKGPRAMAVRTDAGPSGAQRQGRSTRADMPQRHSPTVHTTVRPPQRTAARPRASSSHMSSILGAIVIGWLALLLWGVWAHRLPLWTLGAALALNIATFIAYAADKSAAQSGRWRTQESTLHLLALAGGWPAAGLAQRLLRHKSRKAAFQAGYLVTVLLHTALLLAWLFWLQPASLLNP